jgi:hypothetical protein
MSKIALPYENKVLVGEKASLIKLPSVALRIIK